MSWVTDAVHLFGMFTGDREKRAAQFYELMSANDTLGESSLYLNAGYWDGATRFDDACQRLAEVLGEAADLRPGCAVLDCGFGFGDAALFWIRRFGPETIDGLNITRSQVEKARERVRAAGLEQRVRLHLGSATRMPFADASFDRVTALETAFHFDTREAFFREAFRVLKPGAGSRPPTCCPWKAGQKSGGGRRRSTALCTSRPRTCTPAAATCGDSKTRASPACGRRALGISSSYRSSSSRANGCERRRCAHA